MIQYSGLHSTSVKELPQIPHFKVIRLLGEGVYSKVYKVQRDEDGKEYAIKMVDIGASKAAKRPEARPSAVNEVRLMMSKCHINVIRCYEAFVSGDHLCVVMDYLRNGDLAHHINKAKNIDKTPIPEDRIWQLLMQLCRGLKALHGLGIIHRDLKPANILLDHYDGVKIADLGMSKVLKLDVFTHTITGRPCYLAPEVWETYSQLKGKEKAQGGDTFSSDRWSLGAVLYEMMMREPPYQQKWAALHKMMADQLYQRNVGQGLVYNSVHRELKPIPPDGTYSELLIKTCYGLLAVDPEERPSLDSILALKAETSHVCAVSDVAAPLEFAGAGQQSELMKIIRIPEDVHLDLRLLEQELPPPSYDSPSRSTLHSNPAYRPSLDEMLGSEATRPWVEHLPNDQLRNNPKHMEYGNTKPMERNDESLMSMETSGDLRSAAETHVVVEQPQHDDLACRIAKHKGVLGTPLHEAAVWLVFVQLCKALKALHAKGIVHRDVKPANIMCQAGDFIKLDGMGVSMELKPDTLAYTVTGTPYYMAPEVWQQQGYGFSCDLWSLGAVLYEMMTFRPPCQGRTLREVGANIVKSQISPIPEGHYSAQLIEVCHALLSTDVSKRPSLDQILGLEAARPWVEQLPYDSKSPECDSQ